MVKSTNICVALRDKFAYKFEHTFNIIGKVILKNMFLNIQACGLFSKATMQPPGREPLVHHLDVLQCLSAS